MKFPITQRLIETRVLENYSFMTALSIFSALIGLIIYPYIIRVTGKEVYGVYVYAFTIATFFQAFVDYGFESPCAKAIVIAKDNLFKQSLIVSSFFYLKSSLAGVCSIIFVICIIFVPFMHNHSTICSMTFVQLLATSFFPVWYFQGTKKMKYVTYINLGIRLSTIPFILWLVHSPADIDKYAFIVMLSVILGTFVSYICLFVDGIRLQRINISQIISLFHESTPFFITSITSSLKGLTVKTIIKHTLGIGEVAIYDLAEKIVSIPRFFTRNINSALFPEVVNNATAKRVQRILKYERIIGISIAVVISLLSYPAVLLLGGQNMLSAIPITILLSIMIYTELCTGAYINFVFIPSNRYYLITMNQIISFISFILAAFIGLLIWKDIIMVTIGVIISGIIEVLFCYYAEKKISL